MLLILPKIHLQENAYSIYIIITGKSEDYLLYLRGLVYISAHMNSEFDEISGDIDYKDER
jgi:hypothetical protein